MSRLLLIPAILLLSVLHCLAESNATASWQKGAAYYAQRQYDSAAACFEQIAAQRPRNADLYYNLGNSYYKLNKVGLSVLNYQRALRINPDHKLAKDNLALAQARISTHIHTAEDIFFINWWQNTTRAGLATTWAVMALISFVLIMLFISARRYSSNGRRIPVQLPGIFGFIFVCLMVLAFTSAQNSAKHIAAVVMENDTPLMSDQQKGKPLALIPEGITVKLKEEKAGWIEVSLPDGRIGWVQLSTIQNI